MSRFALGLLLLWFSLTGWSEALNITIDDIQKWQPIGVDGKLGTVKGTQEKIMGKADFVKVAALPHQDPNRLLSEKIGIFLDTQRGGRCSGSLVGPDLFLTNHHCVVSDSGGLVPVKGLAIWMEYLGPNAEPNEHSIAFVVDIPSYDEHLDYALLKLSAPLGRRYGWLQLEDNPNQIDNVRAVKIIQHPAGRAKEIVLDNTQAIRCGAHARDPHDFCYLADTEGGSSGSPVFNLEGDTIIALHKMGVEGQFNAGTQSHFIVEKIRRFLQPADSVRQPAPTPTQHPKAPVSPPPQPPANADQGWKPII